MGGYQVWPRYTIEGTYQTKRGDWISEPSLLIRGSGPADAVRALAAALKDEFLVEMGLALNQEAVAVESSVFGFEMHLLDESDHGTKEMAGRSKAERNQS